MSSLILKLIAMVSMLVDHTACALKVSGILPYGGLYQALRYIGRLAFPIYGFLLVQGAIHTKSKWKYLLRLAILAVLSEVPFDLAFYGKIFYWQHQNVFFTLLIGMVLMEILSKERIVEELNKILLTPKPSYGFELLDSTNLLEWILPQLSKLKGVEMIDGKAHKDNFSHTLQVLDNVAAAEVQAGREPNLWLRWAALLHDIAKPATKRFDPAIGWTFYGHEIVGARWIPKIFQSLKMPLNEKMKYVQKLVELHLRPIALVTEEVTDSAVRRLLFEAGDDIDDLMILCSADITSKNPQKVARLKDNFELVKAKLVEVEAKDAIRNFKNPITGDYVMELYGIGPCNLIGKLKEQVKEAILDGVIENSFEAADAFMREAALKEGLTPVK